MRDYSLRRKQIDKYPLLVWAVDTSDELKACTCWWYISQGSACPACRWQQLRDYNYCDNFYRGLYEYSFSRHNTPNC